MAMAPGYVAMDCPRQSKLNSLRERRRARARLPAGVMMEIVQWATETKWSTLSTGAYVRMARYLYLISGMRQPFLWDGFAHAMK